MMTESLLDRVELTAVARPGIIQLAVRVDSTGCTDLRRIQNLFSNHGHPAWPRNVDIIYGWRGLARSIQLKSTSNDGTAEYIVTNDDLYEMNLLDPPFYVKDVVNIRVVFSEDVVVHSMPFRIGSANKGSLSKDVDTDLSQDSLLRHDQQSQSHISFAGGDNGGDINRRNSNDTPNSWGQTMARAWASNEGSQPAESDFEEEVFHLYIYSHPVRK